jgi:molecular chaperone DnaK
MATVIGIDLGTTNSVVAALDEGEPWVIPDDDGNEILPSCVGFDAQNKLLVGRAAWNQYVAAPERTVRSIKRQMGTDHLTTLGDKTYRPQEISAMILRTLKDRAEAALGEPVTQAVITVPAYFTDAQRQATKEAGEIAGLEVLQIINEPTAAALTYESGDPDVTERVLVYDLGGGTFDVSIVEITGDVTEVLASHGNNRLGGDDFDRQLQAYLVQCFAQSNNTPLPDDPVVQARILRAAETAKIELSQHTSTTVRLGFLATVGQVSQHLEVEVTRNKFEELIRPLLTETITAIELTLKDAKLTPEEIDRVILVGGSTRIPLVQTLVADYMGQEPTSSVQPDLCVALGAVIQAGVIAGEEVNNILVDVMPHSLGIAAMVDTINGLFHDAFSVIIPRNTTIPVSSSSSYTTVHDNQSTVEIRVYQGENPVASKNVHLGTFAIKKLPKRPVGEIDIEVHFDFDANGILTVTATDSVQGIRKSMEVSGLQTTRLSPHEISTSREHLDQLFETALVIDQDLDPEFDPDLDPDLDSELDPDLDSESDPEEDLEE